MHRRFQTTSSSSSRWGLPLSAIASLPLFIHKSPPSLDSNYVFECAICLSVFLEEEIGRKLPGCGHVFHVDCIDMWLYSHSTCPICRSLIICHYSNHIAEYIEIDLLDQEGELELEIHNPQSSPVQESSKTTNMVVQVDSGTSSSSTSE
uniref:RING-H2 finger protein ATL63-like n=1 Tax=Erigeron canadensis TaxID=72917 RepID=UPI001CB9CB07|nr:RING-H2 finger protein ATL63-like [Erigeron canadensis]